MRLKRLKKSWLVEEFGRSIALNAIPRGGLVETNADQVLGRRHRSIEKAPEGSPIEDFRIEPDRDLVGKVAGFPPENSILGKRIAGGNNLRVVSSLLRLDEILAEADTLSRSGSYKSKWPEFNHFSIVGDEILVAKLDELLTAGLNSSGADAVVMTEPDQIDETWGLPSFYVIGTKREPLVKKPFLATSFLKNYFLEKKCEITPASVRTCKIFIKYDLHEYLVTTSAYHCLAFQTSHNKKIYALSGGVWFELSGNLVKSTESTLSKIPTGPQLSKWNGEQREDAYNKASAEEHGFLNFDKQNILIGGGSSKVEACDFVDVNNKVLFYAKRIANKSASMSHFVEQIRRSSEVLFGC